MADTTNTQTDPQRSGIELTIKLISVHTAVACSYALARTIQSRKLKGQSDTAQLVFFILAPTFVLVELIFNLIRALSNWIKAEADDDTTDLLFFFSSVLGVHASRKPLEDDEDHSADRREPRFTSLLDVPFSRCEYQPMSKDWTWIGRIILSTFAFIQGTGTILTWALRIDSNANFSLDDRCFQLAIATVTMSIQSLLILTIGRKWTINSLLPASALQTNHNTTRSRTFTWLAITSLAVQDFFRFRNYSDYDKRHNPSMVVFLFITEIIPNIPPVPFLIILFLGFLMRNEILARLKSSTLSKILHRHLGRGSTSRFHILIQMIGIAVITSDIITKIVEDITEVVFSYPDSEYWKQFAIEQIIPVL